MGNPTSGITHSRQIPSSVIYRRDHMRHMQAQQDSVNVKVDIFDQEHSYVTLMCLPLKMFILIFAIFESLKSLAVSSILIFETISDLNIPVLIVAVLCLVSQIFPISIFLKYLEKMTPLN